VLGELVVYNSSALRSIRQSGSDLGIRKSDQIERIFLRTGVIGPVLEEI